MSLYDSFTGWINNLLSWMGRCLGCATLDDPQKGLQSQGLVTSFSEDFWGSSIGEIDIPIGFMQKSFASLSVSNMSLPSDLESVGTNSRSGFVNNGLLTWTKLHLQWIGVIKPSDKFHQALGSSISPNGSLVSIKGGSQHPVPLGEVVDSLVDRWEHED